MMHDPFNHQPSIGDLMREGSMQRVNRARAEHDIPEPDPVNTLSKPATTARDTQVGGDHYKCMSVQPWDVVDTWPIEQRIGYYRGNALKYLMRAGTKGNAVEDLGKAVHYVQKLIEVMTNKM